MFDTLFLCCIMQLAWVALTFLHMAFSNEVGKLWSIRSEKNHARGNFVANLRTFWRTFSRLKKMANYKYEICKNIHPSISKSMLLTCPNWLGMAQFKLLFKFQKLSGWEVYYCKCSKVLPKLPFVPRFYGNINFFWSETKWSKSNVSLRTYIQLERFSLCS